MRFGYDGSGFDGWARQPGRRTVEGEILEGLVRLGIVPDASGAELSVGSRTDRGVHARANALVLRVPIPGDALLKALNGISPEIRFTRACEVAESFRPRSARFRWYRYFERPSRAVPPSWARAAAALVGRIDIRSFARSVPPGRPVWRTLDRVQPRVASGWLILDVQARAFAWGMVRKIVAALREVEAGRLTLAALSEAARGERPIPLPMADPARLVLWETAYPVDWRWEDRSLRRHQDHYLREEVMRAGARTRILRAVATSHTVDLGSARRRPGPGR